MSSGPGNYIFNGSSRSRPMINLGGTSRASEGGDSQFELIKRAKREREEREEGRLKQRASIKIQAFYRGRESAAATRKQHRSEFDAAISTSLDAPSLLHVTRLLAASFIDGNTADLKRLGAWCRLVLGSGPSSKTPLLFSMLSVMHVGVSWAVLIRRISLNLLSQAAAHPSISQGPLFLEMVKMLCDPNSYIKWKIARTPKILEHLLDRGFYSLLRQLVLSIPSYQRIHPTLPAAIALSLLPFRAFPDPFHIGSKSTAPISPTRIKSLQSFIFQILSIPLLSHRLPASALTSLTTMPIESIIVATASLQFAREITQLSTTQSIDLLANLSALASKSIATFSHSSVLAAYLKLNQVLMDRIPIETLKGKNPLDVKGKSKEIIIIDDDDDDEDDVSMVEGAGSKKRLIDRDGDSQMGSTAPVVPDLDSRTLASLLHIPSRAHLVSLLTLSTRYSASTRPALAAFLVSLLSSFPLRREEIVNTVMFGISSSSGSSEQRGGGLLREIWRGYVRSGSLAKLLVGERSVLIAPRLSDPALESEWPVFILLAELYSRCLMTLGDDEFYSAKNPLTLDEVIGLSSLWRNLAFALYWQEGSSNGWAGLNIVGTRISVIALRSLGVTMLNQIHARDSRRSFVPKDHWLMTSQFDLASFIQTVVLDDENEQDDEEAGGVREADEMDEGRPAVRKPNVSSLQLAFLGPRQAVLAHIPYVIPFESRVAIFRQRIANEREQLWMDGHRFNRPRHRAVVRRQHLSEDAYATLNGLGAGLKSKIEIVFVDEHGMEEQGIDGGGLFKELLTSLSKEIFDTDHGLWLATKDQELYPAVNSYARESRQLSWYAFIGRILGKAMYEGVLVGVRFASLFLGKWLRKQSYLDDLNSLDPELYTGLMFLKNYAGDVEADLSLNFTVTDSDFGVDTTIDLIPNGRDIPVTNENRISYIYLTSNYRLNVQMKDQCAAFFSGLSELIPPRSLRMFNQSELRMLVGGVDQPIDLEDLRLNTVYGGFEGDEANSTVIDFWSVIEGFSNEDRTKLIRFVTACERPPLLGFSELRPRFAIRAGGNDENRLPTSSSCVNLLKLPVSYKSKEVMKQKLLYAINAQAGFDLS